MRPDPFFFPTASGESLFGVWRGSKAARRAWIVAPPLAEEEKSARRALTELAQHLAERDGGALLFSFRGQGDSDGDFGEVSLADWRDDLLAAAAEVRRRAPIAEIALLGVRLGATVALQNAATLSATRLVLVEPITNGRSVVLQLNLRKKIRADLTATGPAQTATEPVRTDGEDMDGWKFGARLKNDLNALDLRRDVPKTGAKTQIIQVGPRPEVAAALQNFADSLGASATAVVMPAFWNLLDYAPATPLLEALENE